MCALARSRYAERRCGICAADLNAAKMLGLQRERVWQRDCSAGVNAALGPKKSGRDNKATATNAAAARRLAPPGVRNDGHCVQTELI